MPEQQLLLTALRHIPIDSQAVLEMTYWEQMTAEVLGESEAAIRGRVRKAKLELPARSRRWPARPMS